ncbi:MAG: hypothetical protein VYA08_09250 [Pseudomonadota bacterium]|nr:hypothetical protein [Pseudomonadota bacterium]
MRNNAAAGVSFTFRLVRGLTASLWLFPWSQAGKFREQQGILAARCCLRSADSPNKNYLDYLLNGYPWTHLLLCRFYHSRLCAGTAVSMMPLPWWG